MMLYLLGIDHELLNYKLQGRRYRLTDVHGDVKFVVSYSPILRSSLDDKRTVQCLNCRAGKRWYL